MQPEIHSQADGYSYDVPESRRNGPQEGETCKQKHSLKLFKAATEAVGPVCSGSGSKKIFKVYNCGRVILLGLVLLTCEAPLLT